MATAEWIDAYVLHRRPYRETSYIIDFFSFQYGRISAVAKGVRNSKNERKSLLQPFQPLRILLSGRAELKNLGKVESAGNSVGLIGNGLFCGLYLNELLNRVMPASLPSEALYQFYKNALVSLTQCDGVELTLRQFEFALLEEMGQLADWTQDGQTGEPIVAGNWYLFSPEQGFILCDDANVAHRLPGVALLALAEGEWNELSRKVAKRVSRLALRPLLGDKPLKSRELFRQH